MAGFRAFLKAGHSPTLLASFIYFTYCCGVWVTNGAMAPFIKESLGLSPVQVGVMLSVPIFAGALMRFPLGIIAQYIGRKNATLVEMGGIAIAMFVGYFFVESFNDLLAMGVLLGIAGASFGVALSLGSGSFPPRYKGLAMGLVGAGNIGTSLAALLAPLLAQLYGWKTVYGIAGLGLILPVLAIILLAKEPDDVDKHASFREHVACLFEKDGWAFAIIYAVTFGGFIGLTTFLPSYYYDQFGVSKIQAGQLTMLAAFMGAALRVFGGWISDHWGGINTLTAVLVIVARLAFSVWPGRKLPGVDHPAAAGVLCRTGRGQRRLVSTGAAALATDHRRSRVDDRRNRRPGRRAGAQCHGTVQTIHPDLPVGLRFLRRAGTVLPGNDARHATPLDPHLGRKGWPRAQRVTVRSTEVRSTEVRSTEVRSTAALSLKGRPRAQRVTVRSTEVRSTVALSLKGRPRAQRVTVRSTGVRSTVALSLKGRPRAQRVNEHRRNAPLFGQEQKPVHQQQV